MGAALAARLTAARDSVVARLDTSLREVTGDPAALRKAKDTVAQEATVANTMGRQAGQHATAAEAGWQGGAYASMRARVAATTAEFTDSGAVLTKDRKSTRLN